MSDFTVEAIVKKVESTDTIPFTRFNLQKKRYGFDCIYCFVEGHDLPYYNIRVEAIAGRKCVFIDSGGKKNVINIEQFFQNSTGYNSYKKLYFVDRDYDDNSNLDRSVFFVTPGYSVENLYNHKNIVDKYFMFLPEDEICSICNNFISEVFNQFVEAISLFCAWYYCIKKREQKTGVMQNVNLQDTIDQKYVPFIVDAQNFMIQKKYTLDDLNADFGTDVTESEITIGLDYIRQDPCNNVRGKYIFQFLENLFMYFNKDSKQLGPHKYNKNPLSINCDKNKLMNTLSNIADTPDELRKYILNKYPCV